MDNTLTDLVKDLIEAENTNGDKGREIADKILSKNFIKITKANGEEQDREKLLDAIKAGNKRTVEDLSTIGEESDKTRIVRSIVKFNLKSYRNNHVFVKEEDGKWHCTSWQVTELK